MEKMPVSIYLNIPIGSTGAVGTLDGNKNKGVLSVTRTALGSYTVKFGNQYTTDTYKRVLAISVHEVNTAHAIVVGSQVIADNSTTGSVEFGCLSATATFADPDSGSVLLVRIDLANSV